MHLTLLALICIIVVFGFQFMWSSNHENKLKLKTKKGVQESSRRAQHTLTGLVIAFLRIFFVPEREAVLIIAISAALIFSLHLIRLHNTSFQKFFTNHFSDLLRTSEINGKLPGCFFFLAGTAASFALFPSWLGLLMLLHLSFGDPIAGRWGRVNSPSNIRLANGKSRNGFLACWIACSSCSFLYLKCVSGEFAPPTSLPNPFLFSLLSGLSSALCETLLPTNIIDDNFALPVGSGCMHVIIFYNT